MAQKWVFEDTLPKDSVILQTREVNHKSERSKDTEWLWCRCKWSYYSGSLMRRNEALPWLFWVLYVESL